MNSSENKMSLNNLATIFGPNLLRAACMENFLMDVVTPVNVVLFFLHCSEEYFDESLFRGSPDSTAASSAPSQPQDSQQPAGKGVVAIRRESSGSVRQKPRGKDEEEAVGDNPWAGVLRRSSRRSSKNTTPSKTQSASSLRSFKESVI